MFKNSRIAILAGFIVSALFSIIQPAFADIESAQAACVVIHDDYSQGSGFIISNNGFIVTNAHVIMSNDFAVTLTMNGHNHDYSGKLCYLDDILDIAVIKIEMSGLKYVTLGDDTALKLGDQVFAIGSPQGFTSIVTDGIFSSYNEELQQIQHTAQIAPGSSGGPLVTKDGDVVGINDLLITTTDETQTHYYFAIPIHAVKPILEAVQSEAHIEAIKVNTDERIAKWSGQEGGGGGNTENPGLIADADYIAGLIDGYPTGWYSVESPYGFYIEYPDFFTYQETAEEDYVNSGSVALFTYDSTTDPNAIVIPALLLSQGDPSLMTYNEFKIAIDDIADSMGFVLDEESKAAFPDVAPDGYTCEGMVYEGLADSEYPDVEVITFLMRPRKGSHGSFYAFRFYANKGLSDSDVNDIEIPVMMMFMGSFIPG
jgi:hypothetical protein